MAGSTSASRPALMIPGPVEFEEDVLQSMAHYSESHVGPDFVTVFGATLAKLRRLFQTTASGSQPVVLSGSGTLGWDMVASNLVEPGERVLVLNSGYFSDGFADCLQTYGAVVDQVRASEIGTRPSLDQVRAALVEEKKKKKTGEDRLGGEERSNGVGYKMLTVTHVDTSTGVLTELASLAEMVREVSPDTLIVVDGVCSVGGEEIKFDEWGLDAVVTASQKAIGCPAGLSISMLSERAVKTFEKRQAPPGSYFASLKNWLPIMRNYEAGKASYFATPSSQLVRALHTALDIVLSQPLAERFALHAKASDKVKQAVEKMGLRQVAARGEDQAHCMTAIMLPDGVPAAELLHKLAGKGIVCAMGFYGKLAGKYIRFGHMGVSVMDDKRDDVERGIKALEETLASMGYQKKQVRL